MLPKRFAIVCFFSLMLVSQVALARVYARAKGLFESGNIQGAQKFLQKSLDSKTPMSPKETQACRELYGVSSYLIDKKNIATMAFKKLLEQDPNASLNPKFILDPGIQTLFSSIQNQASSARSPVPSIVSGGRPFASRGGEKFSGIYVKSNTARATVFSAGLFIGTIDQDISLEPGEHTIVVSAEGHQEVKKTLTVVRGQKITMTVNLRKLNIDGEGTPKKLRDVVFGGSGTSDGFSRKKKTKDIDYSAPLPGQSRTATEADRIFGSTPTPPVQRQRQGAPQQRQVYQPPPGQQFQQVPQAVQDPQAFKPQYQQQPAPMPQGQPQYQQQPAPMQQAQPQYQQQPAPMPQGQPQYQQQPGQIQQGQPQYQQQPAQVQQGQPQYQQQPVQGVRSGRQKRVEVTEPNPYIKKRTQSTGQMWIALLPLGAGQFQNGQYLKGSVFLLAEIGLGYMGYREYQLGASFRTEFAKYTASVGEDPTKRDEQYEADSKKFLSNINFTSTAYFVGMGAVYIIGVLDAINNLKPKAAELRKEDLFNSRESRFIEDTYTANLQLAPLIMQDGGFGLQISTKF